MGQAVVHHRIERWIGKVLRFGVWGSAGLMIAGLATAWISDGAVRIPAENPSPTEVLHSLFSGSFDPTTLMFAGLVLLMLTPFLRVLAAAAGFALEKDRTFTIVSLVIFMMLVGELVYSLR